MIAVARHYFSGDREVSAAVPESTVTPAHPLPASTVVSELRQKKPDVLPVSKEWRLAGYVRGASPYFVLLGPAGQVRRYNAF